MNRIGKYGTYTNTQTRQSFINGAVETGMRDNEIQSVTGQRSKATLNSYKSASLAFKKASSERMLGSLRAGGATWHAGLPVDKQLSLPGRQSYPDRDVQPLVLRTRNLNQMLMEKQKSNKTLMFGKRWKLYQQEVSKRDLYELSVRNQELMKTMLQQQSDFMKMTEISSVPKINSLGDYPTEFCGRVVPKRKLVKPLTPILNNMKRNKRFKTAAELGLHI